MRHLLWNRILVSVFCVLTFLSIFLVVSPVLKEIFAPSCVLWMGTESWLVDIGMWLASAVSCIMSFKLRRPILKPETYCRDEYFVDRISERKTLFAFLESDVSIDNAVFYVKGEKCRGKTALLQKFADDINSADKKSEILDHKIAKKFSAFYVCIHQAREDLIEDISIGLIGSNNLNTCEKISSYIYKAGLRPKALLIIDNICKEQSRQAIETANGLLYQNPSLKIILSITEQGAADTPYTLTPPLFGEMHISELARIYNKKLSNQTEQEIMRISKGIPSYVRMLFQSNTLDPPVVLSNIEDIQRIIEDQLEQIGNDNHVAAYLSCLKLCYDGAIPKKELSELAQASESQIELVYDAALAREEILFGKALITMDALIAQCCRKTIPCSKYLRDIYNFYHRMDPLSEIAFCAQIMLPAYPIDVQINMDTLSTMYQKRKYLVFAKLGDLDEHYQLEALYGDISLYNYFRYLYLSSLLHLGKYSLAFSVLHRYENSVTPLPTLRDLGASANFEMNFLIIDLHHLSNQFELALGEIEVALASAYDLKTEQRNQLLYLKSHCLKHLGHQLDQADDILKTLEIAASPNAMCVKALYSRLAIHLFWEDKSFDYENTIRRIEEIVDKESPEWMHALRHIAHYQWKRTGSAKEALQVIQSGLNSLEMTRWRIIYDFYFEKAEWMRIENESSPVTIHSASDILSNYDRALCFAEENQDINLACCARLGKMLSLYSKCGRSATWCSDQQKILDEEYIKMRKAKLEINKAYVLCVKTTLMNQEYTSEFIRYCTVNRFNNLKEHMKNGCALKLAVM